MISLLRNTTFEKVKFCYLFSVPACCSPWLSLSYQIAKFISYMLQARCAILQSTSRATPASSFGIILIFINFLIAFIIISTNSLSIYTISNLHYFQFTLSSIYTIFNWQFSYQIFISFLFIYEMSFINLNCHFA